MKLLEKIGIVLAVLGILPMVLVFVSGLVMITIGRGSETAPGYLDQIMGGSGLLIFLSLILFIMSLWRK